LHGQNLLKPGKGVILKINRRWMFAYSIFACKIYTNKKTPFFQTGS